SIFIVIVLFQWALIRLMLPQALSRIGKALISLFLTVSINTVPFLYMMSSGILDQFPWWHRELVIFPYAILMVASAVSGMFLLVVWCAALMLSMLWPGFDRGKRRFLSYSGRATVGASLGVLAFGTYYENKTAEISRLTLSYRGLHPDLSGFRLVHITDIHAGPLISFETIRGIVSRVNALKPDLIVLTGDYVNHNPGYIHGCLALLDELEAPAGVFGVYGNHDYYTGMDAMKAEFAKTRITMLSNSRQVPNGMERLLNIIGAEDPVSNWATDAQFRDLSKLSQLVVPDHFNLLLSHRPGIFQTCQEWNVGLTLAGHTHGGQFILPGVGERGFSLAGFFVTYTHGLYASAKNPEVRMYVNRGIGTIVAPVRLFCKPEIVEITLEKA
ncbi:MAG: metallophosphoesterase, partial [Deltaproteobacteria bacterium]|nr:metallophosphoesterase [Deltaproteobacteria bacterium]